MDVNSEPSTSITRRDRRGWLHAAAGGAVVLLSAADTRRMWAEAVPESNDDDASDARIDPDWIVHSTVPANREPALPKLVQSWVTPVEHFYVRSHAANPKVDSATFRLKVDGLVERPESFSLEALSTLPRVDVTATMTCAGNRRYEHSRTQAIKGVPWREGAIGNAVWGGYRLSDLLRRVGVRSDARHVWFDGLDRIERSGGVIPFGASIPIQKAMVGSPAEDASPIGAIVCDTMNGKPLTPDHGFPLRLVVPGYIGARSVKWVGHIHVADRPNPNHYQATAYKLVQEATPLEWAERAAIYRFPINATLCESIRDDENDRLKLAGYALPPGDPRRSIRSVDWSVDGGGTWRSAELIGPSRPLCWRLWKAEVPRSDATTSVWIRATDDVGQSQPEQTEWNKKGYLYNAIHRVTV